MYTPITKDGAQWTADLLPGSSRWVGEPVPPLPEGLASWLAELRLLRHLPFQYLVPRPELLPQESIRFFYVDPTFVDRLVEGALSAANLGAADQALSKHTLADVRLQVDNLLAERAGRPAGSWSEVTVTGLLLRSSLVRRWPGLEVRGFEQAGGSTRLPVLRHERVGDGILIVLFAGVPQRVEVQEPNEGTHFGFTLEPSPPGACSFSPRGSADQPLAKLQVPFRGAQTLRLVDFGALSVSLAQALGIPASAVESSRLAHSFQRTPYVQIFKGGSASDDAFLDRLTASLGDALKGGQ